MDNPSGLNPSTYGPARPPTDYGLAPPVPAAVQGGAGAAPSSLSAAASPLGAHATPSTPSSSSVGSALPAGKTPGALRKMGTWIKQNPTLFAGIALASVGAIIAVACLASGVGAPGAIIGIALIGIGAVLMVKSTEWDASRQPEKPRPPLPGEIHDAGEAARRAAWNARGAGGGAPASGGAASTPPPQQFGPAPPPPIFPATPPPPSASGAPPSSSSSSVLYPPPSDARSASSNHRDDEDYQDPTPRSSDPIVRSKLGGRWDDEDEDDLAGFDAHDDITQPLASRSSTPPPFPDRDLSSSTPISRLSPPSMTSMASAGPPSSTDTPSAVLTQEEIREGVTDTHAKRGVGNMLRSWLLRLVS